jgi:hypothetical protein
MERLFSPCTRLYDLLASKGRFYPALFQELNLDVSTEELLSAERAFTYADLYAMLGNEDKFAWLTPHTAVARRGFRVLNVWEQLGEGESYRFCFNADGKDLIALARSTEHLSEICDVIVRLLAASVVHSVTLDEWSCPDDALIRTFTLSYFMEHCQSLKVLSLENLQMDENHCRVLGAYSRPGLKIVLDRCKITSTGTSALAEVLGRNQGPTDIVFSYFDNCVLANGLCGNSRLKSLKPRFSNNRGVGNREVLEIAGALKENKGLVDLNLIDCLQVSDETWGAICDSLETHPTLEVLDLCSREPLGLLAPAVLKSRIQALVDMLKVNMSIHTLHLPDWYGEHELFRRLVVPYLETNRFRPRILTIQKSRPITYRVKLLGRALLSTRTDANSFWMLFSGNAEVAFPSRTTAVAANLPTPATAAATSTT